MKKNARFADADLADSITIWTDSRFADVDLTGSITTWTED